MSKKLRSLEGVGDRRVGGFSTLALICRTPRLVFGVLVAPPTVRRADKLELEMVCLFKLNQKRNSVALQNVEFPVFGKEDYLNLTGPIDPKSNIVIIFKCIYFPKFWAIIFCKTIFNVDAWRAGFFHLT